MSTAHDKTSDEYGVLLRSLLGEFGVSAADIDAAILASVVPPLTQTSGAHLHGALTPRPSWSAPDQTGMPILYENPVTSAPIGCQWCRRL
ncbi:MAG: type III pantothenate kinase [Myxococcota bacterium]